MLKQHSNTKNRAYVYSLSAGHMFVDFTQGALAALLPFLIEAHHFNYAIAATLVFSMNFISSLVQPLFGILSDKREMSWLLPLSLVITGFSFSIIGITTQYSFLILLVILCGIGVAAYHPESAQLINRISVIKGRDMGIFSFGGNLGFAVGPILLTSILTLDGLKGTLYLTIPSVVIAILIYWILPNLKHTLKEKKLQSVHEADLLAKDGHNNWPAFGLLALLLFSRSIVFYGLNTFLSLYWINVLGQSKSVGSLALGILFVVGSIGTLLGGRLADKFGFIRVIQFCFTLLPFFLLVLPLTHNASLAAISLLPIGLLVFMPYSPLVLLGQDYLGKNVGLASGITLGLSVSIGGMMTPILGMFADSFGLSSVLYVLFLVGLIPCVACYFLKKP